MSFLGKLLFAGSGISLLCFAIVRMITVGWVPFLWVALALFVGLLLAALVVERRNVVDFLTMKTTKQGMSMGAMILLVLVTLVALNFVGARQYLTFDLSQNKVNSLSEQSVQLVRGLEDELKVIYFFQPGAEGVEQVRRAFVDLIRKYQDRSPLIRLEFVNINQRPDLTEKYQITRGTQAVILEYRGRTTLVEKVDEQEITSGIVKVTREKDKKIYFTSGHRELPLEASQDGRSAGALKALLEGSRYLVETLNLVQTPNVPEDADALIVLGAQSPFLDYEVKALEAYLARGGSLLIAAEPNTNHGLSDFLKSKGVEFLNHFTASSLPTPFGVVRDSRVPVNQFSTTSEIMKPFKKEDMMMMVGPQGMKKTEGIEGIEFDDLLTTSSQILAFPTQAEVQRSREGQAGPFVVGLKVKGPSSLENQKFQMLVFGDVEMFNDQNLYQFSNRDLALNAISFLAKEANLISIAPRDVQVTPLTMTDTQKNIFVFGFVVPLPFLMFAASAWAFIRRRRS